MIKEIIDFENDLLERMSRSYYDELLYFTAIIPEALINFNDILLLKKGQKYVSHTNLIFQKSIAQLFKSLSKRIDLACNVCKTDGGNGRGVYIKSKKMRWHFVGQEKFVNFPRVSWFNFKEGNGDCFDLYAVMIQKNNKGEGFIEKANEILEKNKIVTKKFVLLEDFVIGEFGLETWIELKKAMNDIESKIKKYQWFGLVNYYNDLTKTNYLNEIEKRLIEFDYRSGLINSADPLTKHDISVLQKNLLLRKVIEFY